MILRKPYAILIKYFKSIHIVMFVLFVYLVFALRKIYIFFSNYIKTSNYVYTKDIVNTYVPWRLIIIVLLLLALSLSILLLMHKKEKPVLFYRIMIIYCIFLIGALIYFMTFFGSLENTIYEPLRIVVNRDISLFAYLFNFFFVAFTFIRGFGFDIKKFSFDKDKRELNLEESDNEEYELNVSLEKDDVKSFFKRHRRELKYYVRENKLILSIIGILIIVIGGVTIYNSVFVTNKIYTENEDIHIGKLVYRVNSSIASNIDKYGQEISDSENYLIIDMNIINNGNTGYLDNQTFRIHIDNDYYYPSVAACNSFSDMGLCYKNQELKTNTNSNYILVYKVKKEFTEAYLEILKKKGDEYQYNKVKLSYTKPKVEDITSSNKEFELSNSKYIISSYSLIDKTTYEYQECIDEKCSTYKKIVSPNTGEIVLMLEIDKLEEISDDILDSSLGIKYNNISFSGKDIKLIAKNGNTAYYSVPKFLKDADEFTLLITTRKIRYNIVLGGVKSE